MNYLLKILVLSDITFDPISREIYQSYHQFEIDQEYHEDLSIILNEYDSSKIKQYDYILIHSEQLFHRKNIEWHLNFFESVGKISKENTKGKFILTNTWSNSYSFKQLKKSFGSIYDKLDYFGDSINMLLNADNIYILDIIKIVMDEGYNNLYNHSLGILYQMPYSKKMIKLFASELVKLALFLESAEKKVIILDCDNTLWGGIIGEDGIDGIKCDKNADGYLFYHFQLFLKERINDGFLLCLVSKNNDIDVQNAFSLRNMPLKWDDFIIKKVNWNEKSQSIKEIARELNLGEESFIFIDDNLFEIELIEKFTSVKSLFHFTNDYNNFNKIISDYSFRKKKLLESDSAKFKQYQTEKIRIDEKLKFNSIDEFLDNLEIKIEMRINDIKDFDRLSQLTEKTNQFNFNKQPYTRDELIELTKNGYDIFSIKVSDKFGDYGTVGLILAKTETNNFIIENFIMSCRALGKKIEKKFISKVLHYYEEKGISLKEIFFKETSKNLPAKQFLNETKYGNIITTII